ncbi:16694_t:CDS:2, partial [Acaulospora morrowiae]
EIAGIFLSQFVSNISQPLNIVGTESSTNIDSLKLAFSQIKLNSTIPPFGKRLLLSSYVIFQNDTLVTGKALGGFTITNPFTSNITISELKQVNITFHDIPIAFISNFSFPLTVKGRDTITSPPLPINVNLTPTNLVATVKAAAADKHIDITPLLPLLELIGGGNKSQSESQLSKSGSDEQSALKLLEKILGTLNVDVSMSSNVLIDQFPAPLSFVEKDVPCAVNGVDIIITQIALPIAQGLVGNSTITVNTAIMSEEQAATFNLHINGVIGNVGKVKAKITFPTGVNVSTEGKELGIAKLPPVTSNGTGEASINSDSVFQITNVPNFSEFVLVLLGGPSANWTLSADDVQVDASGIPVSGIKFSKVVPLLGFDGLKQVKVLGFSLPGIAPDGNVIIDIDISLENPSNVGISLGTITFNVFSDQLFVGPITATGVTLAPKSAANISFTGEIVIKDPKILSQLIAVLFSGKGNLTAKGDTIKPPGAKGDVPWLSGPFKQLALVVPIPSLPTTSPVKSVGIKSLDLAFTVDTAFNPDSSSSGMVAEIQLPIRLPSPIISVSQNITIIDEDGGKVASLAIASAPATQVGENVTSTYKNVSLTAIDKTAFAKFIGELTVGTVKTFSLSGIVSSTLKEFLLPPIPFSLKTSMK